jgi:DeoR family transcriptional regulator, suf operon transcriptional repressor
MSIAPPDPPADSPAFGSTKREILLILKREGQSDLQTLSERLHISKMAVHKHAQELEERGLIERLPVRGTTGRPRLALRLAPSSTSLFPRAYAGITCAALAYIEEKLGRKAVEEALRRRQAETLTAYHDQVKAETLAERVHQLAGLRDREGYMAEDRQAGPAKFEILEHNCPILAVAENYWEACTVENELFQKVLGANVETTHRVVAGGNVCRFLVTPKRRTPG